MNALLTGFTTQSYGKAKDPIGKGSAQEVELQKPAFELLEVIQKPRMIEDPGTRAERMKRDAERRKLDLDYEFVGSEKSVAEVEIQMTEAKRVLCSRNTTGNY